MKKFYILAVTALLALSSCTGDKNNNSSNSSDSLVLPKSYSYVRASDSTQNKKITISYSGNKILKMINSNGDEINYIYTGDLITKTVETTTYSDHINTTVTEYDYTNNILTTFIKTVTSNTGTDDSKDKYVVSYNSDGTILRKLYGVDIQGSETLKDIGQMTFTNENMTKYEYIDTNETVYGTLIMEYDNNNNIFKNVLGMEKLIMTGSDYGSNNRTKGTTTNNSSWTTSYKYNSNGYPIEKKDYDKDGNLTGTTTYNYQ